MPHRTSGAENGYQEDPADSGSFASLASARHMMLTTFDPDGGQETAVVHGVADGGRFYFGAWSHSGTVRNLRHTDAVQAAPCGALGFVLLAPVLDAVARPLPDDEASRVAGRLARSRRGPAAYFVPLLHRARRQQMVYYELLPYETGAHAQETPGATGRSAADPRGNPPGAVRVTVVRDASHIPGPAIREQS
jgi:PPOX class probable F420-dependent enzyme